MDAAADASGRLREPPYPLPRPGEIVSYDFRPPAGSRGTESYGADRPIRLLQWNIERGYKLADIINTLREVDADVLALQEIDVHCERSGWEDTGRAIAEALGLSYAFVCEFEELHSPVRTPETQGGGVHGNAILSKFDIVNVRAVEHTTHPVDWNLPPAAQPHAKARKEPRRGRRLTAAATVLTHQGPLLVYSAHLEVFCGALARMAQLSDIFRDTRQQLQLQQPPAEQPPPPSNHDPQKQPEQGSPAAPASASSRDPATAPAPAAPAAAASSCSASTAAPTTSTTPLPVAAALMGDLNTMGNGVARLSPHYCTDHMRWGSLGWFEAELLDRRVLAVQDPEPTNRWAQRQGLPEAVCRDLVNPGYADPFDPRRDITFDHYMYRWLNHRFMTGKLDWVLMRGCNVVSKRMGNHDYSASDHKWLQVDVRLQQQQK